MIERSTRSYPRVIQLCESCQNFAGGEFDECPWTSVGPDGKVKCEPVPGWTAEKVPYRGSMGKELFSYIIRACPLYIHDGKGMRASGT